MPFIPVAIIVGTLLLYVNIFCSSLLSSDDTKLFDIINCIFHSLLFLFNNFLKYGLITLKYCSVDKNITSITDIFLTVIIKRIY